MYNAIINHTGLKGNRATPITSANLHEVRETKMPAVLLECGFMDSKTDVPIILTDDFADKVASACVEVIVAKGGLTRKPVAEPTTSDKIYRIQVGAFKNYDYAQDRLEEVRKAGFTDAIIV